MIFPVFPYVFFFLVRSSRGISFERIGLHDRFGQMAMSKTNQKPSYERSWLELEGYHVPCNSLNFRKMFESIFQCFCIFHRAFLPRMKRSKIFGCIGLPDPNVRIVTTGQDKTGIGCKFDAENSITNVRLRVQPEEKLNPTAAFVWYGTLHDFEWIELEIFESYDRTSQ